VGVGIRVQQDRLTLLDGGGSTSMLSSRSRLDDLKPL